MLGVGDVATYPVAMSFQGYGVIYGCLIVPDIRARDIWKAHNEENGCSISGCLRKMHCANGKSRESREDELRRKDAFVSDVTKSVIEKTNKRS